MMAGREALKGFFANLPEPKSEICGEHGAVFEYFDDGYFCPVCHKQAVAELARKKSVQRLKRCRIEPMYHQATFETFRADTPELKRALRAVKELVTSKTGKLIFSGKNGTGKTHLGCAAVRELRGEIWSMYEIATLIRASYRSGSEKSELEIVDRLASIPLLVIDEIGRTKGSDAETNWLSYIIDKRHVRMLPLILITNKHLRKHCPEGSCGDCLENYIGNDVMSRFAEDGSVVLFGGADYRRKKREPESTQRVEV